MAIFNTYTCDFNGCGKQNARRYTFPYVDYCEDASGGSDIQLPGHVDLCDVHQQRIFDFLLLKCDGDLGLQRAAWTMLLGKMALAKLK